MVLKNGDQENLSNLINEIIDSISLIKDTHREKSTLKLNSCAYEKYEYGHLGR